MSASTLRENLNSDFMRAYSALQPKHSAQKVLVYVEADEDIAFWRHALHPFESQGLSFDIQLPSKTDLSKGKQKVLKLVENNLGPYLIACVDSDLDYLLPHASEKGRLVIESPYIFHTYAHSIENYFCYASSLHKLCVTATLNDRRLLDFEAWLALYSQTVYDLFLWMLFFRHQDDHTSFSLSEFSSVVKILKSVEIEDLGRSAMAELHEHVEKKLGQFKSDYPDLLPQIEALSVDLRPLGLTPETAYLFIQGHTLLDNVVLMFLKPICTELSSEKFKEIDAKSKSEEERKEQRKAYHNRFLPIDTIIRTNTDFQACFLYQKLQADLQKYVEGFS